MRNIHSGRVHRTKSARKGRAIILFPERRYPPGSQKWQTCAQSLPPATLRQPTPAMSARRTTPDSTSTRLFPTPVRRAIISSRNRRYASQIGAILRFCNLGSVLDATKGAARRTVDRDLGQFSSPSLRRAANLPDHARIALALGEPRAKYGVGSAELQSRLQC